MKLFCIGLNKSGTTTIEATIRATGIFQLGSQVEGEQLLGDYIEANFPKIVNFSKSADFFQDVPFSLPRMYEPLAEAFPDAKFILTVRNSAQQWYSSIVNFHSQILNCDGIPKQSDIDKRAKPYPNFFHILFNRAYKTPIGDPYNRKILMDMYNRHIHDVKEFFQGSGRLLVVNVAQPNDFERFFNFIGICPPHNMTGFPMTNRTLKVVIPKEIENEGNLKKIAIFGASGQAAVVTELVEKLRKYWIVAYVKSTVDKNEEYLGRPIISEKSLKKWVECSKIDCVVIAIGDNYARLVVSKRLSKNIPEISYETIIDPSAQISDRSTIGNGSVILNNSIIGPMCKIGVHCLINKFSSIDHDSIMEDFSSCAPGVICGGNLKIGKASAVCIGCTISNKVSIGKYSIVGAGSLVLKDLPENTVAYGRPCKNMRKRKKFEPYL